MPTNRPAPVDIRHGVLTAIPPIVQSAQTESPNSNERPGSAAEKQAVSDPGPVDQFTRRRRIRELSADVEKLAADYFAASEPLREALNAILRADPAEWIGRLYEVQPLVRGLKLTDSRFGAIDTTEIQSAESLARHTLIHMGDAIVQDDRTRFDVLSDQLRAEPAAARAALGLFPAFVSVVLTHSYLKTRPEFLERAKAVLARAGMELWWAVGDDFKKVGAPLSTRAADAICHWCDPFDARSHFSNDGLLAPPGWRTSYSLSNSASTTCRGLGPEAKSSCATTNPPRQPDSSIISKGSLTLLGKARLSGRG
jgi:hypothetical protein